MRRPHNHFNSESWRATAEEHIEEVVMGLCSFLLVILTGHVVSASYYTHEDPFKQCSDSGNPHFGIPVDIGNITSDTVTLSPAGLAHSRRFRNVLYFINDSGQGTVVYAISAITAQIIGSITITDATNVDWEDMTIGLCPSGLHGYCIYVQDAGSGGGAGPANVIYIVREEHNPATHVSKKADQIINYQLQPGTTLDVSNGIFVDCQANIFFFDQVARGKGARFFQIKNIGGFYTAVALFQIDLPTVGNGPVSLSLSADCCELLIKMEDKIYHIPIINGQFQTKQLSVLPYMPNVDEESIAWSPSKDRYYTVSDSESHTLKVAVRNMKVPDPKYILGSSLGNIDAVKGAAITGLAASRKHPGFIYAVADNNKVLIIQPFQAQVVGLLTLDFGSNDILNTLDAATGRCPTSLTSSLCIYITADGVDKNGNFLQFIFFFPEPENLFANANVIFGASDVLTMPFNFKSPWSIFIGSSGEIYVLNLPPPQEHVDVFQVNVDNGNATLITLGNFNNPSLNAGPFAADISPCFNEIIVKFRDVVLLFEVKKGNVVEAFASQPFFLPYIPEENGHSVAFSGCDAYMTTSQESTSVPLMVYHRDRQFSQKSVYHF